MKASLNLILGLKFTNIPGKWKRCVSFISKNINLDFSQRKSGFKQWYIPTRDLYSLVFCSVEKMAHVFGPRRGTERSKDRSCMKISPNATTQRMALPFAAVRNSKRQEDPLSSSESNLVFDTFPKKIEEDEQFILKQIEDAWQAKDLEAMFHLIKVSNPELIRGIGVFMRLISTFKS